MFCCLYCEKSCNAFFKLTDNGLNEIDLNPVCISCKLLVNKIEKAKKEVVNLEYELFLKKPSGENIALILNEPKPPKLSKPEYFKQYYLLNRTTINEKRRNNYKNKKLSNRINDDTLLHL